MKQNPLNTMPNNEWESAAFAGWAPRMRGARVFEGQRPLRRNVPLREARRMLWIVPHLCYNEGQNGERNV